MIIFSPVVGYRCPIKEDMTLLRTMPKVHLSTLCSALIGRMNTDNLIVDNIFLLLYIVNLIDNICTKSLDFIYFIAGGYCLIFRKFVVHQKKTLSVCEKYSKSQRISKLHDWFDSYNTDLLTVIFFKFKRLLAFLCYNALKFLRET